MTSNSRSRSLNGPIRKSVGNLQRSLHKGSFVQAGRHQTTMDCGRLWLAAVRCPIRVSLSTTCE